MYVCMYIYIYIYIVYISMPYTYKYAYGFAHLDKDLSNPFKANVPITSTWGQQKLHLLFSFSGVLRWCGMGAFSRNGSFTDMVHGM